MYRANQYIQTKKQNLRETSYLEGKDFYGLHALSLHNFTSITISISIV